jgi:hypothetical protein
VTQESIEPYDDEGFTSTTKLIVEAIPDGDGFAAVYELMLYDRPSFTLEEVLVIKESLRSVEYALDLMLEELHGKA